MTDKPRVRVPAGSIAFPGAVAPQRKASRVTSRYLRGERTGLLHMRQAITRDARVEVLAAAERASALALDFMHNSGWLSGAADQIVCDVVGEELKLNCRAKLDDFGYTTEEANAWRREVEAAWRQFAWNPKECDLAGVSTVPEMVDGVVRSYLAYGEAFAVLDYLTVRQRRSLGANTGLKVSLVAPHRCVRTALEHDGFDQGVFLDQYGRPKAYRFKVRERGVETERDIPAGDVIHVMDRGANLNSPRGISPIAPALKVIAQYDQLADATLATALMQTVFAATINSPEPSDAAFDAIRTIEDSQPPYGYSDEEWGQLVGGIAGDLFEVWGQRLDALKENGVSMTDPARINHLGPGEEFQMHTAQTPGAQYLPFANNLKREMARCLGVTFESLSLDFSNANYSSVRMATATLWPVMMRRRTRIAIPFVQEIYERWLIESITAGRIPFGPGVNAFLNDMEPVMQAEFHGPAAPVADDWRAVNAAEKRLELGLSTYADECALMGRNWQEQITQISREIDEFEEAGVPAPFGRKMGGSGGPLGGAMDGDREPPADDGEDDDAGES